MKKTLQKRLSMTTSLVTRLYIGTARHCIMPKLNPVISNGNSKEEDMFDFNKDAGMFVCPVGHMNNQGCFFKWRAFLVPHVCGLLLIQMQKVLFYTFL